MTGRDASPGVRGFFLQALGISVGVGLVIAFVIQTLVPALANVPGYLLCGGEVLELVLRKRTSYGVCGGGGGQVDYVTILCVSSLVWSVISAPLGIAVARWLSRKAGSGAPPGQ